jgi:5'-nucleotidase
VHTTSAPRHAIHALCATGAILLPVSGVHALDIALTNDDGWSSRGVQAMKAALVDAGHRVTLAAPLNEQSGSSAAINTGGLLIRKERDDDGALEFSVAVTGGTDGAEPATSSLLAIDIARQRSGHLPDLLVSGINAGANIGAFTQVSGTVGAAIVAISSTFNGAVPAIAISTDAICSASTPECDTANDQHFGRVARFVVNLIAQLEQKSGPLANEPGLLPQGLGLNINYPPMEMPVGVKIAQQGRTAAFGGATSTLNIGCYGPCAIVPVGTTIPGGITGIAPDGTPEVRNADTTAFVQGYVTIVPIEANYTADPAERLNAALRLKSLLTDIAN